MFEKLKELSKIFVAFGIVLYLFGFISIASYLARFGIISFDIVNSRFIIAGFFSFIAIVSALLIVWHLYNNIPLIKLLNKEKWENRIQAYIASWSLIWIASYALSSLFNLGKYSLPAKEETLIYKPLLGKYDLFGYLIDSINVKLTGGLGFVFKFTLNVFSQVFIFILLLFLVVIIRDKLSNKKNKEVKPENKIEENKTEIPLNGKKVSRPVYFLRTCVETLILSFFVSVMYYSYLKLKASLFDFSSFEGQTVLNSNLFFMWFYVTIISTYFFLNIYQPKETILLDSVKNISSFDVLKNMQLTFQYIFIPIIAALILFGQVILPRIPFSIGGGEPREIELKIKHDLPVNTESRLFLIGESSQFIFVVAHNKSDQRAFQINKSEVEYIQTRKNLFVK